MQLIPNQRSFSAVFTQLLRRHSRVYFATAWASSRTYAFEQLVAQQGKIIHGAIGTHFYQTCPEVLREFVGSESVRFVLSTDGVFHPKAYLFESDRSWDAVIGSANFTAGALKGKNQELLVHFGSSDFQTSQFAEDLKSQINVYWSTLAQTISTQEADAYASVHRIHKRRRDRLARQYAGEGRPSRPLSRLSQMSWATFAKTLQADVSHLELQERLEVCRDAFRSERKFSEMAKDERMAIAGLPSNLTKSLSDPAWFGSMRGAGWFHKAVANGHGFADEALSRIPSRGTVNREDWIEAMQEYSAGVQEVAPRVKRSLGTFTRLCAMKRPDVFLCSTKNNQVKLKEQLALERTCSSAEDFWDLVICGIQDSPWWLEDRPSNPNEKPIWLGRAALLDALVYVGNGPPGRD